MRTFINTVIINGIEYTDIVKANSYKEAIAIQKKRKAQSGNTFKGRLIEN